MSSVLQPGQLPIKAVPCKSYIPEKRISVIQSNIDDTVVSDYNRPVAYPVDKPDIRYNLQTSLDNSIKPGLNRPSAYPGNIFHYTCLLYTSPSPRDRS